MNHSRTLNNRINRIHERSLRIVYNDKKSTFQELLAQDKSVTIHIRNLQVLVTEMFKVKNGIAPEIMNNVFQITESNYNFRKKTQFKTENVKTTHYGTETISNLGPKLWKLLPSEYHMVNCPCRLCKRYVQHVGFI